MIVGNVYTCIGFSRGDIFLKLKRIKNSLDIVFDKSECNVIQTYPLKSSTLLAFEKEIENQKEIIFNDFRHEIIENSEGWYYEVKADDVDGDGDVDMVVGNLGLNYKYKASIEEPFEVHSYDFDNNGTWDMMMSSYEGDKNYPVRGRDCSSEQMPFITDSFPTFKAYAIAEITEICGPKIDTALHLTARGFYTSIFLNDGKGNFSLAQSLISDLPKIYGNFGRIAKDRRWQDFQA